jgi:hypothetical protein
MAMDEITLLRAEIIQLRKAGGGPIFIKERACSRTPPILTNGSQGKSARQPVRASRREHRERCRRTSTGRTSLGRTSQGRTSARRTSRLPSCWKRTLLALISPAVGSTEFLHGT